MNKIIREANNKKCEIIIKNLEKRQMNGYYCENIREAEEKVLSMISDGDLVSWGGSVTIDELDIKEKLPLIGARSIDVWQYKDPEEARAAKINAFKADVFLTSTNAITLDGQLVNIDGTGNRIAAMAFGPRKVIIVVGVNKIVSNVESAEQKIKIDAATPNCLRLGKKTPCATIGKCTDCMIEGETSCCSTVVTRFSNRKGRMHIILVNDTMGY